ncbi:MAG: sensor histidine kinase [Chitinophagaceae bacterium]
MYRYIIFLVASIWACKNVNGQGNKINIDSALNVIKLTSIDTIKTSTLIKIGKALSNNDIDKSLDYFLQAYNFPLKVKQDEINVKLTAASFIASSYLSKGDLAREKIWAEKCKLYLPLATDVYAKDVGYNELSTLFINAGKFDSGIYYAQKKISIWDSLRNPQRTYNPYYAIAYAYFSMKLPEKCLETIKKLEPVIQSNPARKNARLTEIYILLTQLYAGVLYKYDSALLYSNKGLAIAQQDENIESTIDLLNFKCDALYGLNKYESIKPLATKAYKLAVENGYNSGIPAAAKYLSYVFAKQKLSDSAIFYAKISEKNTRQTTEGLDNVIDNYEMWSNVYHDLENYRMAFLYKDSQYMAKLEESKKEIKEIAISNDIKFESAKKQAQIENLDREKKQIKTIQWLLVLGLILALISAGVAYMYFINKKKAALQIKLLMKELHHRVKNNLQIVSSLLSLQSFRIKDKMASDAVKVGQQRIEAMSLIHQRLYTTDNITEVNLKEYITDLCENLMQVYGYSKDAFDLQIQVSEAMLNVDKAIPLSLIINELVTNAFKYAFKNVANPTLAIVIQEQEGEMILTVKDNGSGLDVDAWKIKTGESFGKELVKTFTKQLDGKVLLNNENGTIFTIRFPL